MAHKKTWKAEEIVRAHQLRFNSKGKVIRSYHQVGEELGVSFQSAHGVLRKLDQYLYGHLPQHPSKTYLEAVNIIRGKSVDPKEAAPQKELELNPVEEVVVVEGRTKNSLPSVEENYKELQSGFQKLNESIASFLETERFRWELEHEDLIEENQLLKAENDKLKNSKGLLPTVKRLFGSRSLEK